MSRDGAQSRIDSIRSSANNIDRNTRTALGNATRFNTMVQLFNDRESDQNTSVIRNSLAGQDPRFVSDKTLANALDTSIRDLTEQFNAAVGSGDEIANTHQSELANKAYRTELGSIISKETSFNRGRFFEANAKGTLLTHGDAGYAFNSFTSSFSEGDDDAFGSRVLYDNVFGAFESGEVSLSQRAQQIDPEDYGATASQKVLQTLVNKNLLDSRHSLNKVDREFQAFFGQSNVDAASESGTGLIKARQLLNSTLSQAGELANERRNILNSLQNLQERNANGVIVGDEEDFDRLIQSSGTVSQRVEQLNRIENQLNKLSIDNKIALDTINNSYSQGYNAKQAATSTIVNKSGVREFVNLFNSAKDSITIQTYQFQNQTLGTVLRDVAKRRILERIGDSTKDAFELNLVLAYPKQRTFGGVGFTDDDRYNIGEVGYAINGPNLIEVLSMKQMEEDLIIELHELGYSSEDVKKAFKLNVEFRDRKFHPKLYMTDTMAAVGTQNLTAPVGNSINQAGSNFEQMYIVHNHMSDAEIADYRAGRVQGSVASELSLKDTQLRSSLLYRQIKQASQYEREFIRAQGKGTVPAMSMGGRNSAPGYNVGFAGDIYKHLTDTIDYAYNNAKGISHGGTGASGNKKIGNNMDLNMFMILDGSFMLQVGDIAFNEKALVGEMGDEVTKTFQEKDPRVTEYRSYQNKLFDLLITNNANVVVDKKNFKEGVYDPIADKIEKEGSDKLKRNFAQSGKNLGLMAGNNIFGADIDTMHKYLIAQGFTKEAGYSEADRKQIMGMGSGNIRMAKTPRQHAKSHGLVKYDKGDPKLISYYQGSSNLGFYSLNAGDKTNTEIGVMFGEGDLSRVRNQAQVNSYSNELDIEATREAALRAMDTAGQLQDFSLTEEQEINELRNIQDRFYHTYNQLSTNTIENRYIDNIKNAPMWQSNVNSGALQIQKARLEDLKQNLGLNDTAFKIVERLGEDGGVKSLNITINMASVLGDNEFTNSTTPGKKLNFEISVLNSPLDKRIINQNSPTDPRNGSSDNPGMVYFVDKNKLIGNGIFVNDSGQSVEVMGRKRYEDAFQFGTKEGTIRVGTGESAHMSSIDITTQIFGQLIGEAVTQRAIQDPAKRYSQIAKRGGEDQLLTDYFSVMLTGRKSYTSADGTKDMDSLALISSALKMVEFDSVAGDIMTKVHSSAASTEKVRQLLPSMQRASTQDAKMDAVKSFINTFRTALADEETNLFGNLEESLIDRKNLTNTSSSESLLSDRQVAEEFMDKYLLPNLKDLVRTSPELLGEMLKYADTNNYESIEQANLNSKISTIFEPFLQSAEDTTYGGQQGYYRTLMYGLSGSNNRADENTADIMNDYGDEPGLDQARKSSRLVALGYTPTTNIHEFLYRSIASGASSTGKTDQTLNSSLLQQKGRQVGSAQNFDVLQSIGIGTKVNRSDYVTGFGDDLKINGALRQSLYDQGFDDTTIPEIEAAMRKDYKDNGRQFMSQTTIGNDGKTRTKATNNMVFFTGNAKKLSALPQRIKNALGARPLYQYGVKAQQALQSMTEPNSSSRRTLTDVTNEYVNDYGKRVNDNLDAQISYHKKQLNDPTLDEASLQQTVDKIRTLSMFKQDLTVKAIKNSSGKTVTYQAGELFKLGAVYTGNLKSVLSKDQASYVSRITEDINTIFNDPDKDNDDQSKEVNELKQEMIRSYVLRASLDNSGLGKMIVSNDRTNYSIALLQLSGTYTDTFVANSLQGNVYKSEQAYTTLKANGVTLDDNRIDKNIFINGNTENLKDYATVTGQREGYLVTQQLSTKSSMMAEQADLKATDASNQGERSVLRVDDIVSSDDNGRVVQLRDGKVVQTANEKRTLATMRGEVDNTTFGISSSVATKSTSSYARQGEFSIDYVFGNLERDGNFANNEYLQEIIRLRSILPGGARRVEGTDSSALIKGVANFAGQGIYRDSDGVRRTMNTFQYLESQIEEKFNKGEVGGSLAAMLRADVRQHVFNSNGGYTPLSSMVSGLYNANNFKSFVWSHGATILKETQNTGMVEKNFMLNELLGIGKNLSAEDNLKLAQKAASGLLLSFGSSYLKGDKDAAFKKAIIQGIRSGAAGKNYQKLAGVLQIVNGGMSDDDLFKELVIKTNKNRGIHFNDANLGGLRGLNSDDIAKVMAGGPEGEVAAKRFMAQITGLIATQAKVIGEQGYLEMSSFNQRQAGLMVTAIDLMHQISANETGYHIPGDIDTSSERMKGVLTTVLGGKEFTTKNTDEGLMDEAFQMIQGINQNIGMVSLFADISYSQSKDPVGTETVGRHEAQHLMMPFLGDLKNFREGGQLSDMQHTFASLMSLSHNTNSIMAYNALQKSGFGKKKAWDMTNANSMDYKILSSSFTQEKFLGFYRANVEDESQNIALVKQFKKINRQMIDGSYHDLNLKGSYNLLDQKDISKLAIQAKNVNAIKRDIVEYVDKFYSFNTNEVDADFKQSKVDEISRKIFGADGRSINNEEATRFLMQRQDLVVMELQKLNDVYNANSNKSLGSHATAQFVEKMSNKEMFFSLPEIDFMSQDGMAIAKTKGSITTFLPSAAMMKKLGVQHADFIDPLISVYKSLTEVFVPGSIPYNALQKVMAAQKEKSHAVLTAVEATALQQVMQAAHRMPLEAQRAIEGARAQQAWGGKTKYKGFTSTGIGSLLVPFDAVALSTAKLAEAGYTANDKKTKALQLTLQVRNRINTVGTESDLSDLHRNSGKVDWKLEKEISKQFRAEATKQYKDQKQKGIKEAEAENVNYKKTVTWDPSYGGALGEGMQETELERLRAKRKARKQATTNKLDNSEVEQEKQVQMHTIIPREIEELKNVVYIEDIAKPIIRNDKEVILAQRKNQAFQVELQNMEVKETLIGVKGESDWAKHDANYKGRKREEYNNQKIYSGDHKDKGNTVWDDLDRLVYGERGEDSRGNFVRDNEIIQEDLNSKLQRRYSRAEEYKTKLESTNEFYNSLKESNNLTTEQARFIKDYEEFQQKSPNYKKSRDRANNSNQYIKPGIDDNKTYFGPAFGGLGGPEGDYGRARFSTVKEARRAQIKYDTELAYATDQDQLQKSMDLNRESLAENKKRAGVLKHSVDSNRDKREQLVADVNDRINNKQEQILVKKEASKVFSQMITKQQPLYEIAKKEAAFLKVKANLLSDRYQTTILESNALSEKFLATKAMLKSARAAVVSEGYNLAELHTIKQQASKKMETASKDESLTLIVKIQDANTQIDRIHRLINQDPYISTLSTALDFIKSMQADYKLERASLKEETRLNNIKLAEQREVRDNLRVSLRSLKLKNASAGAQKKRLYLEKDALIEEKDFLFAEVNALSSLNKIIKGQEQYAKDLHYAVLDTPEKVKARQKARTGTSPLIAGTKKMRELHRRAEVLRANPGEGVLPVLYEGVPTDVSKERAMLGSYNVLPDEDRLFIAGPSVKSYSLPFIVDNPSTATSSAIVPYSQSNLVNEPILDPSEDDYSRAIRVKAERQRNRAERQKINRKQNQINKDTAKLDAPVYKTEVPKLNQMYSSTDSGTSYITDLIPGRALVLTDVTKELQNRVKTYYDLQLQALVEGISRDLINAHTEMVEQSTKNKQKIDRVQNLIASGQGPKNTQVISTAFKDLYTYRNTLQNTLSSNKSLDGNDRYLYETALINAEADVTRLELVTKATYDRDEEGNFKARNLTKQEIEDRVIKREVFGNITSIINITSPDKPSSSFPNLGRSDSKLEAYELFDERYSASKKVSIGDIGKNSKIVDSLKSLGSNFTDKEAKLKAQKEMAFNYLDGVEKQYQDSLNQLREFSKVRDPNMLDSDKEIAGYKESLESHKNVMESISTARKEIKDGKFSEKWGMDKVFTALNLSILINDKTDVETSETFRSPPPGSTDPRLHSYRIMNGVTALNRIATMIGAGGMSETRNQTSSYITAVGVVTYGGGDFDGDPYTSIINKNAETATAILDNRMEVNKNEILLRHLEANPLAQSATEQQKVDRAAKIKEAQEALISNKRLLAQNEKKIDTQMKQGYKDFNARARRQAAEYFGMDEELLIRGNPEGKESEIYKDPDTGEVLKGYGERTYNADNVFALMESGHKLIEGIDQNGPSLFKVYDVMDQMFGHRHNAKRSIKNIKEAASAIKTIKNQMADPESVNGKMFDLFTKTLEVTRAMVGDGYHTNEFITNILMTKDAATATSMMDLVEGIEKEELKYRQAKGFTEDMSVELDENNSKEFIHHFIGGSLWAEINRNNTYQDLMKKGAGLDISEGGLDVLLKTLGTAGGEVLGKTYNTIIGTTFKDSSLITLAQAVMTPDEKGEESKLKRLIRAKLGEDEAKTYFENTESALGKARGVQGFMKNIHQLLRDSIKLKADQNKDVTGELQNAAAAYETVSEKIRKHDLKNRAHVDYKADRKKLVLERDASINFISSNLGDGPGLKALMDLNYLISNSKKTDADGNRGLNSAQYSTTFLNGATTDSDEFRSSLDRYNQEIEEQYNKVTGTGKASEIKRAQLTRARLDQAGSTTEYDKLSNLGINDVNNPSLIKLAQYQTANQMTNLVASYRMRQTMGLNADAINEFAKGHLKKSAFEGNLTSAEVEKNIVDSYLIPVNPLEIKGEQGKAAKLRKIEALASYLGIDNSSLYKGNQAQAQSRLDAEVLLQSEKAGVDQKAFLISFDMKYENSRKQASSLFGVAGEGLDTFTNLEALKSDMSDMFKSGDEVKNNRMSKLLNIMDSESLQMMTQLIGSDKLMTSGFQIFNNLFEGVLSNVMSDELDKVDSLLIEEIRKEPGKANLTEEEIRQNPNFNQMAEDKKRTIIARKSIQLQLGGGEGDRSTSAEGSAMRSTNVELMDDDQIREEYRRVSEGSLTSQQTEAMTKMAEHIILKSSQSEDQYNKMLEAVGGKITLSEEEKIGLTEAEQNAEIRKRTTSKRLATEQRLEEQQNIRFVNAVKQQSTDRKAMATSDPYLKRGSIMSKLGDGLIGTLATNKGSTALDLLVPIALTALGSAVSEGAVDSSTLQDLTGATFTASMYARTGFVDGSSKVYGKRMAMAQGVGAVFKFRSALNRYQGQGLAEGEKAALAARDTLVREGISMAVNRALAPTVSQTIASKMGNNQAIALDITTGKQHRAVQQLSGNIGASLISAATSTIISGLILKTTVPNPEKNLHANLQQFDLNVATVNSVNQQIAQARANQAAAEDVQPASSEGEIEISSYNVVTSSTYGADSQSDSMALYEERELDMGADGSLSFDFA